MMTAFIKSLLGLSPNQKKIFLNLLDYLIFLFSVWVALSLVNEEIIRFSIIQFILVTLMTFCGIFSFYLIGMYKSLIKFSFYQSFLSIFLSAAIYNFLLFLILISLQLPINFFLIHFFVVTCVFSLSRYLVHWILDADKKDVTIVAIYGAGTSGRQLQTIMSHNHNMRIIAFLDDDKTLHGKYIQGVKVHDPSSLDKLIENDYLSEVFIAIPSLKTEQRVEIIKSVSCYPIITKSLPGIEDLEGGKVSESDLKRVKIEDLLKREVRKPKQELLSKNITNKVVLITGAGGSIGSELVRQAALMQPKALILFEVSEVSLYQIEMEIEAHENSFEVISILGDVRDSKQIRDVIRSYDVDTIYHAAAYKHVPLVEKNIIAGIKTNIFGSYNCIKSAITENVENFVLISTDKAVRPTNIMGATKRFSEIIIRAYSDEFNKKSTNRSTQVTIVRFGNVLGSSGSVVPLFREQIRRGGPITVTHPEIVRYFMTISEAAQLVIQASALKSDSDIFILDMGQPIKILDLAKDMIKLSGQKVKDSLSPHGDIEIKFSGLRPGEKLFEELLIDENSASTDHEKIIKAIEERPDWENFSRNLVYLDEQMEQGNTEQIFSILKKTTDYKPSDKN